MTRDSNPDEGIFSVSDQSLRQATGRNREAWFSLLDAWGAQEEDHAPTAAWLVAEHSLDGWWAQTVTIDYERARRLGPKGGQRDGTYDANASKTIAVPVAELYRAIVDPAWRARWLPGAELAERTVRPDRSARFDWGDGTTRVHIYLTAKSEEKSQVSLQPVRLPNAAAAHEKKVFRRERLGVPKALLEG